MKNHFRKLWFQSTFQISIGIPYNFTFFLVSKINKIQENNNNKFFEKKKISTRILNTYNILIFYYSHHTLFFIWLATSLKYNCIRITKEFPCIILTNKIIKFEWGFLKICIKEEKSFLTISTRASGWLHYMAPCLQTKCTHYCQDQMMSTSPWIWLDRDRERDMNGLTFF